MAIVRIPDTKLRIEDAARIQAFLGCIGIDYEQWDIKRVASDAESDAILTAYQEEIEATCRRGGYTKVDVINVRESTPGLAAMLERFNREHWHDEDEVRFILCGRGIFHIHPPGKPVVAIEVGPGDWLRVPRGTQHWFDLCADRRIVAIRFFQDPAGWTPHYTESQTERRYEPVCLGPAYLTDRSCGGGRPN